MARSSIAFPFQGTSSGVEICPPSGVEKLCAKGAAPCVPITEDIGDEMLRSTFINFLKKCLPTSVGKIYSIQTEYSNLNIQFIYKTVPEYSS